MEFLSELNYENLVSNVHPKILIHLSDLFKNNSFLRDFIFLNFGKRYELMGYDVSKLDEKEIYKSYVALYLFLFQFDIEEITLGIIDSRLKYMLNKLLESFKHINSENIRRHFAETVAIPLMTNTCQYLLDKEGKLRYLDNKYINYITDFLPHEKIGLEPVNANVSLITDNVCLCVSGYTSEGGDSREAWGRFFEDQNDIVLPYGYKWPSGTVGKAIFMTYVDYWWTAFTTGPAGLIHNNDFRREQKDAEMSGRQLARMLSKNLFPQNITLMGFSLGT